MDCEVFCKYFLLIVFKCKAEYTSLIKFQMLKHNFNFYCTLHLCKYYVWDKAYIFTADKLY